MGAIKTLLTFEEFEQLPEAPGKAELLEGELIQLPPAKKRHNKTAARLYVQLLRQFEELRKMNTRFPDGEPCIEMGYLLGRNPGSWLQPDVSITWANQAGDDYFEGSPMLAFEIVSDANRPAQIARKRKKYIECGAGEVWVIYPETRHAMVFTKSGERRAETAVQSELLPGIEIPFADIL
jgi:Uma2 family endonuclease